MSARATAAHVNKKVFLRQQPGEQFLHPLERKASLIARFMRPTWGPSGVDRTQVGPMSAPWTLLSGIAFFQFSPWPGSTAIRAMGMTITKSQVIWTKLDCIPLPYQVSVYCRSTSVDSLYRLNATLKNAADRSKRRHHTKVNSIHQTSVLDGDLVTFCIISDFIDIDTLGYIFVASNIHQSMHFLCILVCVMTNTMRMSVYDVWPLKLIVAFTWTNVDWSSVKSSDIHIRAISQEMPQPPITKIGLKITHLKFHSYFPGVNELTFANDFSLCLRSFNGLGCIRVRASQCVDIFGGALLWMSE